MGPQRLHARLRGLLVERRRSERSYRIAGDLPGRFRYFHAVIACLRDGAILWRPAGRPHRAGNWRLSARAFCDDASPACLPRRAATRSRGGAVGGGWQSSNRWRPRAWRCADFPFRMAQYLPDQPANWPRRHLANPAVRTRLGTDRETRPGSRRSDCCRDGAHLSHRRYDPGRRPGLGPSPDPRGG